MPVNITGSRYNGAVVSYSARQLSTSGATFASADFNVARIVAFFTSANAFKGIAYIRRWVSATVLELEYDPFDPVTNLTVTLTGTDVFNVSLRLSEVATVGLAVTNTEVVVSDSLLFGTANNQRSLCLYDETKDVRQTAGASWDGQGGVVCFGHLLSTTALAYNGPVNFVFQGDGTRFRTVNTSFHGFWYGGSLIGQGAIPFFGGNFGSPGGSLVVSGTAISEIGMTSPSAGGAWSSNPSRHVLRNISIFAAGTDVITVRWGNGVIDGGAYQLRGTGPISVFGSDAVGTYVIGAPAGERLVVSDTGIGNTLWRSGTGSVQTINFTNVVSVNRRSNKNENTLNYFYADPYRNGVAGTKIVINRSTGALEASGTADGVNPVNLTVLRSIVVGSSESIVESNWNWGAYVYGRDIVAGSFGTTSVTTIEGSAPNISHGTNLIQTVDALITQSVKATVDAYPFTVALSGNTWTVTGDGATLRAVTAQQLYDKVASYMEANFTAADIRFGRTGETIDATAQNVNIDLSYIAFMGNFILNPARTLTLQNGSTVSGTVIDSTANSSLTFAGINSWIVYASEANRDSNTSPLGSGTLGQTFRFNFSAGTTYWLRLAVGVEALLRSITPTEVGVTAVDLSTTALLSGLPTIIDSALVNRLDASDLPGVTASAVRLSLAVELARIDVATSTRSTLTAEQIPAGLTVAQIEASEVLAKEASVTARPTLLQIEASTVIAKQSGFTGLATATNVTNAQTAIVTEVNANETKIDAVKVDTAAIKAKTDVLVNAPTTGQIRLDMEAAGSKLDIAANKSKAAWVNTL